MILRELFEEVPRDIEIARPRFVIGRAPGCHFCPTDGAVSWHHCKINIDNNRVTVRDVGSDRGTFVDGRRIIGECELKHGDVLEIGLLFYFVDTQREFNRSPNSKNFGDLRSQPERKLLP